jgi:hypothetical protein
MFDVTQHLTHVMFWLLQQIGILGAGARESENGGKKWMGIEMKLSMAMYWLACLG